MDGDVVRRCDGCTMCCKLLSIRELNKPEGVWCEHCSVGVGCQIYEQRPGECSKFHCGFLQLGILSEDWRPSKCKIVLAPGLDNKRLTVNVDPDRPDAWKAEPYYSQLKKWAVETVPESKQVVVYIGPRAIVILPDKDVDLGDVAEDELIITTGRRGPGGIEFDAIKLRPDDPGAAHLKG